MKMVDKIQSAIKVFKTMRDRISNTTNNPWSNGYRTALNHVILTLEDETITQNTRNKNELVK